MKNAEADSVNPGEMLICLAIAACLLDAHVSCNIPFSVDSKDDIFYTCVSCSSVHKCTEAFAGSLVKLGVRVISISTAVSKVFGINR